jgi:hypothetical protein
MHGKFSSFTLRIPLETTSLQTLSLLFRHDYEGIKEDMIAWWPLLKKGGLFAGHDFVEDGTNAAGLFGVQRAVKEFVDANGKEAMSISEKGFHGGRKEPKQRVDGGWTTWYFFK